MDKHGCMLPSISDNKLQGGGSVTNVTLTTKNVVTATLTAVETGPGHAVPF